MGDRLIKLIRLIVGKLILLFDRYFPAQGKVQRSPEVQAIVDAETKILALYQFEACPFCVKVRRAMKELNLSIETRDAKQPAIAEELKSLGGELQVPCLRVEQKDKAAQWIYESDDIIAYLVHRFQSPTTEQAN